MVFAALWVYCAPDGRNYRQGAEDIFAGDGGLLMAEEGQCVVARSIYRTARLQFSPLAGFRSLKAQAVSAVAAFVLRAENARGMGDLCRVRA